VDGAPLEGLTLFTLTDEELLRRRAALVLDFSVSAAEIGEVVIARPISGM
jgi:hypothetical protein